MAYRLILLSKGLMDMKKATARTVAFVSVCSISSVANWVDGYGRILCGFLNWDSPSGHIRRRRVPLASDLDVTWAAELFGIAVSEIGLEPRGSAEGTVAGKIRNRRQVSALHVCIL
jgi:hypothetical protein